MLCQLRSLGECLAFSHDEQIGRTEAVRRLLLARLLILATVRDCGVVLCAALGPVRPDGNLDATVLKLCNWTIAGLRVIVIGPLRAGSWRIFLPCVKN
jgi:hypothetical protein